MATPAPRAPTTMAPLPITHSKPAGSPATWRAPLESVELLEELLMPLAIESMPEAVPLPSLEKTDPVTDAAAVSSFSEAPLAAVTAEEAVATARVSNAVELAPLLLTVAPSVDSASATGLPVASAEMAVSVESALPSPDSTAEDSEL